MSNATAIPALAAKNTERHGCRFTAALAVDALRPAPSMAIAVARVAVLSTRAILRDISSAFATADTFLRACPVNNCAC